MAIIRSASAADFAFEAGGYGAGQLLVTSVQGSEGISELFRFKVDLGSTEHAVDFESVVGEPATLTIVHAGGERVVHGIVSRFELVGRGPEYSRYRATVVPRVWTLTRRHGCRIFQDLAVPDIVKKMLEDAGIPPDEVRFSLKATYKPREYCVQYRESDWSFIARLFEDEGIFYFFEHDEEKHVLVIGDDPAVHLGIEGDPSLPYREPSSGHVADEHVYALQFAQEVRSGTVTLRDFEFKKPDLKLEAGESAERDPPLEIYDYPGLYCDLSLGKSRAQTRLQAYQATRCQVNGLSDCRRLVPGFRFALEEHFRDELNQEYLIVHVDHWGEQPQSLTLEPGAAATQATTYQNSFLGIPSSIPFRPPRIMPRPRVEGPQTAIVVDSVDPPREEVYVDEHGRVRVKFHWDRNAKKDSSSSCWVRVSQAWAGAGWGAMFIPRVGQEVVVDFLEGDPDRPIITGRVYNGLNPPPYGLPADKTKSTTKSDSSIGHGGSNEIRFEDKKGSEEVYVHAQKDMNEKIENNMSTTVGVNQSISVGGNQSTSVGGDRSVSVSGKDTLSVTGDRTGTFGANRSASVTSNDTLTVSGNRSETVSGSRTSGVTGSDTLKVGGARTEELGSRKATVGGTDALDVGGGCKVSVSGDHSLSVGGSETLKVGGSTAVNSSGAIQVSSGAEITLSVGGSSIKIDSGGITLQSSGAIKISAGGSVDVTGGGQVSVTGAVVNVNS